MFTKQMDRKFTRLRIVKKNTIYYIGKITLTHSKKYLVRLKYWYVILYY